MMNWVESNNNVSDRFLQFLKRKMILPSEEYVQALLLKERLWFAIDLLMRKDIEPKF